MSTLYPQLPERVANEQYALLLARDATQLTSNAAESHTSQFFAATGGTRATTAQLGQLRNLICKVADEHGFPDGTLGRRLNSFDVAVAELLHTTMGLLPAEAANRRVWAFLALIVMPDVAAWRFPHPSGDRVLATDITRHVFGRLWWRAELLYDPSESADPYHLLGTFRERNFDQIFARRRSIGGSRELVRALAKSWPRLSVDLDETEVLRDVLKTLMRRGAFQDLYGLPEPLLCAEIDSVIVAAVEAARGTKVP